MGFRRRCSLDIFNGVLSSRAADESLLWTLRSLSRSCPAPGAHRVVPHSFPVTPHHLSSALPFVRDCQRCCLAQPSGAAEGAGWNRLEPAGTHWDRLHAAQGGHRPVPQGACSRPGASALPGTAQATCGNLSRLKAKHLPCKASWIWPSLFGLGTRWGRTQGTCAGHGHPLSSPVQQLGKIKYSKFSH